MRFEDALVQLNPYLKRVKNGLKIRTQIKVNPEIHLLSGYFLTS